MTKRQYLGFTFLTCGLAAFVSVACSDSGDGPGIGADTGGTTGVGVGGGTATGGATGAGGSTGATGGVTGSTGGATGSTGGATGTATGGGGNGDYTVGASGFVTSGAWQGYAWTAVEEDTTIGSTVTPADFAAVVAGDQLCISGTVAPNLEYAGVAMLGINLNQLVDAPTDETPGTAPATGSGVEYGLTFNSGTDAVRIQIQGALGYPDEAWCANVDGTTGQIPWTQFNKECWDDGGTFYDADGAPPLQAIMVLVPGDDVDSVPYDFCITNLKIY